MAYAAYGGVAAGTVRGDLVVHVGDTPFRGRVDVVVAAALAQPSQAPNARQFGAVGLGVHRSLENRDQTEGPPAYILRRHDTQVREKLTRGHTQPTIVTVVGESSCGKTRTMFEAVREVFPDSPLLYPRSSAELVNLLETGLPPNVVLWLDELQEHLVGRYGELVATYLETLLTVPGVRPFCTVASIWPTNLIQLKQARSHQAHGLVPRFLRRFADCEIHVPPDFDEIAQSDLEGQASQDTRLGQAIKSSASKRLAQTLAGGVHLLDSYLYRFSPGAKAITTAAMDLRLVGYPNPIDRRVLSLVASAYLSPAERIQPAGWSDDGLAEAAAEHRGLRALTPVRVDDEPGISPDALDVHDYLFQYHMRARTDSTPPTIFWEVLKKEAANGLLPRTVATSAGCYADGHALEDLAIDLLTYAGDAGDRYAEVVLGHLLAKRLDVGVLRDRATRGDRSAQYHLANYLVETTGEQELAARASAGDWYANEAYPRLLAKQQNVAQLMMLADNGNALADRLLASTLRAMEKVALLTARADAGNPFAAQELANFFRKTGKIDELRIRAEPGNRFESSLLQLWLDSDDEAALIQAATVGSALALFSLGQLYYRRGDLASLRLWADRVPEGYAQERGSFVGGIDDIRYTLNLLLWETGRQEEVRGNAINGSIGAWNVLFMMDEDPEWEDDNGSSQMTV